MTISSNQTSTDVRDTDGKSGASIETVAGESNADQIQLSIVVPSFNESESITRTISSLYDASPLPPSKCEVIVVDESSDNTPDVIRGLDYENIRLMRFADRKGLAGSVIEGFRASRGTYLGVIDADGQHPPAKLYELFETAKDDDLDVVVASRYVNDGGIDNWSWFRKVVSLGATAIAQLFLLRGVDVADPLSGFFVVRRSCIEDVTLDPIGYKILLDILVRAEADSIAEIGYIFTDREHGESNLDYTEYVNFLLHVWSLFKYRLAY